MSDSAPFSPADLDPVRLTKLARLREGGVDPYPVSAPRTIENDALQAKYKDLPADALTQDVVSVCGRVGSVRNSGMFIDLHDGLSKVQVFCEAAAFADPGALETVLKNLDLGDFLSVTGVVRRTKRGELTINARELVFLGKALRNPPEKYHGLTDVESRYRRRYLDILANEEAKRMLLDRVKTVASIRAFMASRGYLEVETPMLQVIAGGANARPFITHHNALDLDLFLRIAPELYLKRLLCGGLSDRLFEINRNFRNEGVSTRHNPEFTMLEAYRAYATGSDMKALAEDLIRTVIVEVRGAPVVIAPDGREIDVSAPFRTLSMVDAASQAVNLDFRSETDPAALRERVEKAVGQAAPKNATWGELVELVFEAKIETGLVEPTHLVDYPADISPLAKRRPDDPRIADRFETFMLGMEIANGFSEMNDPQLQRAIFAAQIEAARAQGETDKALDEDFLNALEHGMPPAGGLGIGIDRLVMVVTGARSIREVIAFPTMRPLD